MDYDKIINDLYLKIEALEKRIDTLSTLDEFTNKQVFRSKKMREAITNLINKYAKEKNIKNTSLWMEIYKKFQAQYNCNIFYESTRRCVSKLQAVEDIGLLNIFRVYVEDYLGEHVDGDWAGDSEFPDNNF